MKLEVNLLANPRLPNTKREEVSFGPQKTYHPVSSPQEVLDWKTRDIQGGTTQKQSGFLEVCGVKFLPGN